MNNYSLKTNIGMRHLKAFLAVAEMQSFVRAAGQLHVAPSALTETIKQLEEMSGVVLLDRTARPVSLTPLGAEFLEKTRRLIADFDLTLFDLRRTGGLESGAVRVGAAPSMVRFPLTAALSEFRRLHAAIDITVYDDIAERLGGMVRDRVVDFALAERWHESADLSYEPLLNDPFVLVCHRHHSLAALSSVRLEDIPPHDLITLQSNTGIGKLLAGHQAVALLQGASRLHAHSTISQLIMISQGLGLALLPRLAATALAIDKIVQVPLSNLDLNRQLCIVTKAHSTLSPAPVRLIELIRSVAARVDPASGTTLTK